MAIDPTQGPGGLKTPAVQTEWQQQDTKKVAEQEKPGGEVNPTLPPPVKVSENQFAPQPMASGQVSATRSGQGRVYSDAMLPSGADVVAAKGAGSQVANVVASAVDHLDPDKPIDSLDVSTYDLLRKFYAATDANPEAVLAASRMIDQKFA